MMGEALAVRTDGAVEFSEGQLTVLSKMMGAEGFSRDEIAIAVTYFRRAGLDPFTRQIYAIKSQGRLSIIVGIDGLRVIAQRTGQMDGYEGPFWKAKDGPWLDSWDDSEPPSACKVIVYRKGASRGFSAICKYDSFVQRGKDGAPLKTWATFPEHMLAIRAESHALRKAFPAETAAYRPPSFDVEDGEVEDGEVQSSVTVMNPGQPMSDDMRALLFVLVGELGLTDEQRHELSGGKSWRELTRQEAHALIDYMQAEKEARKVPVGDEGVGDAVPSAESPGEGAKASPPSRARRSRKAAPPSLGPTSPGEAEAPSDTPLRSAGDDASSQEREPSMADLAAELRSMAAEVGINVDDPAAWKRLCGVEAPEQLDSEDLVRYHGMFLRRTHRA